MTLHRRIVHFTPSVLTGNYLHKHFFS